MSSEEKKERNRKYYINNREKLRINRIKWDLLNKEKITAQQKEYRKIHSKKIAEQHKKWQIKNKELIKNYKCQSKEIRSIVYKKYRSYNMNKIKNYKIKKRYDITLDDYNNLLLKQEYRCRICGEHQDNLNKNLCIDHDHINGNIRGLLCDKCNRGLGHFNDDIELISKALNYLKDCL